MEIIAEYRGDTTWIWITKPLLLPLLAAYYIRRSKRINWFFILALFFNWIANMLFIQSTFNLIIYGVIFFNLYRILVIYIIINKVKMPSIVPLILGSIPFMFIYFSVTIFTYDVLGKNVYLFLAQSIFTIFLGGFSLGNYILMSDKKNSLLLLSTLAMAFNQFIFLLKFYYNSANLFQAIAMVLFILGQFLLTKYIFYTEKKKQKFVITNKIEEI
ncbi:lysoplasmalogenase family protein [Flavobacterium sp. XGLA_31]|uniref:lysoplasmalogenase family protein n=1 Tax=Flavobacterium sp. XGLA_31 TaxID=3447666 RepID=UPI003F418D78